MLDITMKYNVSTYHNNLASLVLESKANILKIDDAFLPLFSKPMKISFNLICCLFNTYEKATFVKQIISKVFFFLPLHIKCEGVL